METAVKKLYEGMFLVDSTQASDWDRVVKTIKKLLDRSDAEIVSIRNWAEKKLAYEINHKSRGTYALCFFKADAEKIKNIEKDVQLSEQIMRVLILGTETRDKEDVKKDMHGLQEEKEKTKTGREAEEKVSPQQKIEKAGKPEKPAAPAFVDVIGPEQPVEPAAVDVIEPEQPVEPAVVDVIEPEQPVEPAAVDVIEPEQPAEPAAVDVIEPEKPAESVSVDEVEPEQPTSPEAADTSEPETEQEPKEPDKKKFFNW